MREEAKATYIADLDYFQTLIEESKDTTLYLPIMFINTRLQKFDDVIHVANKAIGTYPKHTQIQTLYANALIETGRKEEAIDILFDVVMSDEDNYMSLKLLGKVYKGMGDKESALKYVRAAYLKAPEDNELFEWLDELGGLNIVDGKMPPSALSTIEEPKQLEKEFAVDEQIAEAEKAIANLVQDMNSFTLSASKEGSDAITDGRHSDSTISVPESSPLEGPELSDDEIFDTLITDATAIPTTPTTHSDEIPRQPRTPFKIADDTQTNPRLDLSQIELDSFFAGIDGGAKWQDDEIDDYDLEHNEGDVNLLNDTPHLNKIEFSDDINDDLDDDIDDFFDLSKLSTVLGNIEDDEPKQQNRSNDTDYNIYPDEDVDEDRYDYEIPADVLRSFIQSDSIGADAATDVDVDTNTDNKAYAGTDVGIDVDDYAYASNNINIAGADSTFAKSVQKDVDATISRPSSNNISNADASSFGGLLSEPLLKEPVLEHIVPEKFKPAMISASAQAEVRKAFEKKQQIATQSAGEQLVSDMHKDAFSKNGLNEASNSIPTAHGNASNVSSADKTPQIIQSFNPISLDSTFGHDSANVESNKQRGSLQIGNTDYDPYTQTQHDSVKNAYRTINEVQEGENLVKAPIDINETIVADAEMRIEEIFSQHTNTASKDSSSSRGEQKGGYTSTSSSTASPLQFLDRLPSLKDMPDELDSLSNMDDFKLYEEGDGDIDLLNLLDTVNMNTHDDNVVDSKLEPALVVEHTNVFNSKSYAEIASAIIADIDKAIEKTSEFNSTDIVQTENVNIDVSGIVEKYGVFDHTNDGHTSVNIDTSDTLERSPLYDKDMVKQPTHIKLDLDSSLLDTNEGIFSLLSDLQDGGDKLEVSDLMIEHNEWLGDEAEENKILYDAESINKNLSKEAVSNISKPTITLPMKLSDARNAPRVEDPRKKGAQRVSVQETIANMIQQKEAEKLQDIQKTTTLEAQRPRTTTDGKEIVRPTIKTITELPTTNIITAEEQAKIDRQLALLKPTTDDTELVLNDNGLLTKVTKDDEIDSGNHAIKLDGVIERTEEFTSGEELEIGESSMNPALEKTPEFDYEEANAIVSEPITVQQKEEINQDRISTVEVEPNKNLINTTEFAELVMDDLIKDEPAPKDDFERFIAEQKRLKEEKLRTAQKAIDAEQAPEIINQEADNKETAQVAPIKQESTQVAGETISSTTKSQLSSSPSVAGPRYTKPSLTSSRALTPEEALIINKRLESSDAHSVVDDEDDASALSSFIVKAPKFEVDDNPTLKKITNLTKQDGEYDASLDDYALQAQLSSYIVDQADMPDNEEILKNIAERSKKPEVSTEDEEFVLYDKNETYFKDAEIRDALDRSAHKVAGDSADDDVDRPTVKPEL